MQVRRLDLGADVVAIPSRDLLIIHPDLNYAEALGAVSGSLPDLHPDAVVQLVEQVTPRPAQPQRPPLLALATRAGSVAVMILFVIGFGVTLIQPVSADMRFGPLWQRQMERLGLRCHTSEAGTRVCTSKDRPVVQVEGFSRNHSALYVMRSDGETSYMRIFDSDRAARRWQRHHPNLEMAGRVVVW